MNFLALDLATRTGWAYMLDGQVYSGVTDFKRKKKDHEGEPFRKFYMWFNTILKDAKPEKIFFEEPGFMKFRKATEMRGGYAAIVKGYCAELNLPIEGVPVGTIKKHATGKGNAKKADMVAAMKAQGFDPKDDNEADALALLKYIEVVGLA